MPFDGITTKQVVYELNSCLIGGKINKVYQPNKNEILLGIYASSKNYLLLINIEASNCRMHLTTTQKPNPLSAPNFCMLLRKYLIGMKIKNMVSQDLERVITIELEGFDELNDLTTKKLMIELMGKHSNVILLNQNNRIIDSIRHLDTLSGSSRNILPSYSYSYPESQKISFLQIKNFEEFYQTIQNALSSKPIDEVLSGTFLGISKLQVQFVLEKLAISSNLTKTNLEQIYEYLKKILNSSSLSCIPYQNGKKEDYVLSIKEDSSFLNVNFFLDDYYSQKENQEEFIGYRNNVLRLILNELKRYTKRLSNINQKLEECEKKETYRFYGELITANLYQIDQSINLDHIVLPNYYENNAPISIPLDKSSSPAMNAKKYFKLYHKLKNACEIVTLQKHDTKKEIDYIESIIYELENAKTISEVHSIYEEISESFLLKDHKKSNNEKKKSKPSKKKENQEKFDPIQYILEDFTILVGKNNKQNDLLTLKYAHPYDMWFHTKDIHGSHVILKTDKKDVSETILNQCAIIAAHYSKASLSSNVPVDYTYVRYVKKPSGLKPGMVIYTNYTTVNVNPEDFNQISFHHD